MSLFKCRECWLTQCGTSENFEDSSFLMTSLTTEYDLIITGSHEGVIRMYSPTMDRLEDGLFDGYKPTDLIIEKQLTQPILQISRGRLVSGNQVYHLAILHPRSVAVYSLIRRSGVAEPGNQNSLILVYEHQLKRSAYNMTIGAFGGSQTRDFICIQSLDGQLSFYEQENFAFTCFLPDFLLPGPLVYVGTTDSFVTCSSSWSIESFKYKRLSEIGQTDSTNSAIPCRPDWAYLLGEDCTQIQVQRISANEMCLALLAQRSLHCLNQNGQLVFMKRFDFVPISFFTYFLGAVNKLMFLLISEIGTLLIYENTTLRWSARTFLEDCISVRRGEIKGIRGSIALLNSSGNLRLCYLGTEPHLFTAPPIKNRELDFEKVDEELVTLGRIIRNSRNNDVAVTNATTERELVVSLSLNPHLNGCPMGLSSYEDQQMALLNIDILPNAPFTEVQVCVVVQPPLKAEPNITYLENLEQRENIVVKIFEETKEPLFIQSLRCGVVVSHVTRLGVPRIITKVVELPLKLITGITEPLKEAKYKITLNLTHQAPSLGHLFPEFVGENSFTQTSSSISLARLGGQNFPPVTILLAKTSSRYRIQSDHLSSISIVVQKLVRRIKKLFLDKEDFKITTNLMSIGQDVADVVEKHFEAYQKVGDLQVSVTELSTQYRMIQKRLIGKLKERTPTPMGALEKLLLETHKETLECAEKLTQACTTLKRVENELSAVLKLVMLLVECSEVSKKVLDNIGGVLISPVLSSNDQSWEEVLENSITFLLRTVLAKSDKEAAKYSKGNVQLEGRPYIDVNKLKKHLLQLFDRINKESGRIVEDLGNNNQEADEENEELKEQLGSEIAKNTVRAKSAKVKPKLIKLDEDDGVIENVEKIDE